MTGSTFWLYTAGLCCAAAIILVVYGVDMWWNSLARQKNVIVVSAGTYTYMDIPNYKPLFNEHLPHELASTSHCPLLFEERPGYSIVVVNTVPNTATISLARYGDAFSNPVMTAAEQQ